MVDLEQLSQAIITGKEKTAKELTGQALAEGSVPEHIINNYMIPAMEEVGARFERNEFYLPEMLIAARAMQGALSLLKQQLVGKEVPTVGKVVVGTVQGDLHDIGKNLVAMMLEGSGFEVLDLGVDVPPDGFVEAIQSSSAQIIGMSALLSTTMIKMRVTIQALREAGLRDQVKVMIGGAAASQRYAEEIGADGYASNAYGAVTLAKKFIAS
ncbi:MAG: corrinoid protein [Chloroflexi bacterium]|nr:corrinoid protein [Chloroflexota bacterium]MCL5074097.1 corrinoid protein [Chloroflexota bacterium]